MSQGPYYSTGKDITKTKLLTLAGSLEVPNTDNELKLECKVKGKGIDVVNDFSWTSSPLKNSSVTIPYLRVIELEQTQNSLISSALYYINAILNSKTSEQAQKAVDLLLTKCNLVGNLDGVKSKINSLVGDQDKTMLGKYLESYIGMYITQRTGFTYTFPFFEGNPHNLSNSWQSSTQIKSFLSNTVDKGMEFVDKAATFANIMTPGTYIERPKYFHYPEEGESITIKFPLLNTIRRDDTHIPYQQNYELLWILAYQNKPFRTSFSRIIPPKIYTVMVPGMKFFPYAYISKMDVNFLGTRRNLPVRIPANGGFTEVSSASIPDAYEVTITFTSMLADTGNLMINKGFTGKINVTTEKSATTPGPVQNPGNNI